MKKITRVLGIFLIFLAPIHTTKSQNFFTGNYQNVTMMYYEGGQLIVAGKISSELFRMIIDSTTADSLTMSHKPCFANNVKYMGVAHYSTTQIIVVLDYWMGPAVFKMDMYGNIIKGTSWAAVADVTPTGLCVGDTGITLSVDHLGQIMFYEVDTAGNTLLAVVPSMYPGRIIGGFTKQDSNYVALVRDTVTNTTKLIRFDPCGDVLDSSANIPNAKFGKMIKSGNSLFVETSDSTHYTLCEYDLSTLTEISTPQTFTNYGGINDVYLDPLTGNLLLTGWHEGMNGDEVYVAIHSGSGQQLWQTYYSVVQPTRGSSGIINSSGTVYFTGTTGNNELVTGIAGNNPLAVEVLMSNTKKNDNLNLYDALGRQIGRQNVKLIGNKKIGW